MTKPTPDEMAVSLCAILRANVNNEKLTDAEFREFVRNSLPLTEPREGQMSKEVRLFIALRMACEWGGIPFGVKPTTVMSNGIHDLVNVGYTEKARRAEELAAARKLERLDGKR